MREIIQQDALIKAKLIQIIKHCIGNNFQMIFSLPSFSKGKIFFGSKRRKEVFN
jgi:two-component sensor histidine kinase